MIKILPILCLLAASDALSSSPGRSISKVEEPSNKATQIMQGVGQVQVDLNQYNLDSIETIAQEWTANLKQKAAKKEVMVSLGVRSDRELFVDQVTVQAPRRAGEGVGLELTELAGGREDGLGITLVTGVVEGGVTEGLDILPGDSISQITLIRQRRADNRATLSEVQEFIPVQTECLSYDATVDVILSLPKYDDRFDEMFEITLKRIRKKPRVNVRLQYPRSQKEKDFTIELFAGENLRMGMLLQGVKLNDPLAQRFDAKNDGNCGAGGICRTCAVSVLKGGDMLNPQKPSEKQMLADNPRWRLACKAIVGYGMKEGTMTIRVNPRQLD
mmetsp:Transcript_5676/g.7460  ORF Transcript_5676/g.7460 Transcript_5676/m.7460 type:complete len:330 (+) Transcript_5676:189-1178(+)|eukprot:CAMPEP_0198136520 /NCGR_PEP_ID=MMETSP1443-20131203/165_1 /TAXON_ID=186043 /ORGANISM="Entomoneis sp., Strain CCMP2396" /LENGTH=329 /DNA_ID=CAMNT_0043797755 /DNA_START=129 /DNA_END=1118 /DNA_ORIENTATION=+